MAAEKLTEQIMLPEVRGRLESWASLGEKLWFSTGGRAEVLFKPEDLSDLQFFLREKGADVSYTVIGAGSNVIIRDGGVSGVVIRLRSGFSEVWVEDNILHCGSGATDVNVARTAELAGLSGLEFFAGIAGNIGGAIKMNAGAMGSECKDFLLDCEVLDSGGNLMTLSNADLGFSYRSSSLADDWIVVSARFCLRRASSEEIAQKMEAVRRHRQESQPTRGKTGGSTFKNPKGGKAWELIDRAGCRGLRVGGAYMSEKHCNFMLNDGSATASDLENLGEQVRERVLAVCGVDLQWEIKRLGEKR